MKVALTLSGLARNVEECYDGIYNNIIKHFDDIDIFIHTWTEGQYDKITIYSPTFAKIEKASLDTRFFVKTVCDHGNWIYTIKMYKSLYEVGKLVQQANKKYDLVIRERFEHITEKHFDFNLIQEKINDNYVVIPNSYCNAGGYNDQLAFGSMENMIKYFNTYTEIQNLLDNEVMNHPETLLKASLDKQNIKVYQYQHNFFNTQHPPLYHKYFV